jgi:hypothetical protein
MLSSAHRELISASCVSGVSELQEILNQIQGDNNRIASVQDYLLKSKFNISDIFFQANILTLHSFS